MYRPGLRHLVNAFFIVLQKKVFGRGKKSKSKQKLKSAILAIFQRGLGWPFPFSYGPQKMMIRFDKFF
jgi:hypothetical protein